MDSRISALIEPGREATWGQLDAEQRQTLAPPPDTPIGELLRRGQQLSAQAAGLRRAIERANERAPDPE